MKPKSELKTNIFWNNKNKLCYETLEEIHFKNIIVPKFFVSDGPTIPRIFWIITPKTEKYLIASIIHDYCLKELHKPWRESNKIMRQAMRKSNVFILKRIIISIGIEFGMIWDYIKYYLNLSSNVYKIKEKLKK